MSKNSLCDLLESVLLSLSQSQFCCLMNTHNILNGIVSLYTNYTAQCTVTRLQQKISIENTWLRNTPVWWQLVFHRKSLANVAESIEKSFFILEHFKYIPYQNQIPKQSDTTTILLLHLHNWLSACAVQNVHSCALSFHSGVHFAVPRLCLMLQIWLEMPLVQSQVQHCESTHCWMQGIQTEKNSSHYLEVFSETILNLWLLKGSNWASSCVAVA